MSLYARRWGAGERIALLLHGMSSNSETWHAVGPALAARGYGVVAIDLPRHGHSPRDPAATVENSAAALREPTRPRPALAVEHSLGGLILAAAGSRLRPERAVYGKIRVSGLTGAIQTTAPGRGGTGRVTAGRFESPTVAPRPGRICGRERRPR
jgi:pimeloyl-ACP methyl ester carboxylesterase